LQVVSVGKNPLPLTEIPEPAEPVPELNAITGAASRLGSRSIPTRMMDMVRNANADLKETLKLSLVVAGKYQL